MNNEELQKVRNRIDLLQQELDQLREKESALEQTSTPPNVVGKYFKLITDHTFTYYVKVNKVEFNKDLKSYMVIGQNIIFDVRLIRTTVSLHSQSILSYDRYNWKEITQEDYDNVMKEALTYF